jgi:hypothetical protein
VEAHEEPESIN